MSPVARSFRRLLAQPDFVIVALLLGISAMSLNFATDYLKLHFRKRPVPMRATFDAPDGIPERIGRWAQVSRDRGLDPDTEHVLGTSQYVYRDFVDVDAVGGAARVAALREMSADDRNVELERIAHDHPESVLHLGLTYYTGMVDTVAHIPDRCYLGDGFDVGSYRTLADQRLGDRTLTFRYLSFDDQTGRGRVSRRVAYFFNVNGRYESDPLGVRRSLQNLLEPYGYYAKVELMAVSPGPTAPDGAAPNDASLDAMKDFLTALLPEFERCLPDWQAVHHPKG